MVLLVSIFWDYGYITVTLPTIGALSYLVCILLNKYVFFKNIIRYDYWSTLGFTIIGYFVYMLMCMIIMLSLPNVPLFAAFNLVYVVCIPLRYALHKLIFIATLTKD